ncbi:(2Fe-2S)-binding protein [Streptomyces sp. XM4193]|uniref:(2Fe-2S)-binding protein n=1 Tax=Streptomyces sp. XM4193 TaxID=2929782 RepID=UPI001FF9603A|nr:(2Fe-2S)-binding protein [Streptomyces sp. XM4193]MCK1796332.1 (2Fe-2S)-binding protein [Streptomyces sp. XM4193]
MYVCSCFGVTEQQVREHADAGACTPRQIASACKAGTDCGSCVRRIQGLLGRGACADRSVSREAAALLAARSEPVEGSGDARPATPASMPGPSARPGVLAGAARTETAA